MVSALINWWDTTPDSKSQGSLRPLNEHQRSGSPSELGTLSSDSNLFIKEVPSLVKALRIARAEHLSMVYVSCSSDRFSAGSDGKRAARAGLCWNIRDGPFRKTSMTRIKQSLDFQVEIQNFSYSS